MAKKLKMIKALKVTALSTLAASAGVGVFAVINNILSKQKTNPRIFNVSNDTVYGFAKDVTPDDIRKETHDGTLTLPSCKNIAPNAFNADKYSPSLVSAWPKKIEIDISTENIGDFAFYHNEASTIKFYKIVAGQKINVSWKEWKGKSIGVSAFAKSSIEFLGIPSASTYADEITIGDMAFYGCESLSTIDLSMWDHSPTKVGDKAFSGIFDAGVMIFNDDVNDNTMALTAANFSTPEFGNLRFWANQQTDSDEENASRWQVKKESGSAAEPICHPIPGIYLKTENKVVEGIVTPGGRKGPSLPITVVTGELISTAKASDPIYYGAVVVPTRNTEGVLIDGIDDNAFNKTETEFTNIRHVGFESTSNASYIGNYAFYNQLLGTSASNYKTNKILRLPGTISYFGTECFYKSGCKISQLDISNYEPSSETTERQEIVVGSNAFGGWLSASKSLKTEPILMSSELQTDTTFLSQLKLALGTSQDSSTGMLPDAWFKWWNQVSIPDSAITYITNADGERVAASIDVASIPQDCNTLSFTFESGGSSTPVNVIGSSFAYDSETGKSLLPSYITTLDLGSPTLTKIGEDSFREAENVVELILGANIEEIGDRAFKGCVKLGGVQIPASLKKVGKNAFENAFSKSEAAKTYENYLDFSNLDEDKMREMEFDGHHVFKGLPEKGQIIWPSNISTEAKEEFKTKLILAGLPEGWFSETEGSDEEFADNYIPEEYLLFNIETGVKELIGVNWTDLEKTPEFIAGEYNTLYIPSTVTSVRASAFYDGTQSLIPQVINRVQFGTNSVLTSIGAYAFKDAQFISNLKLPSGCTDIGQYAFSNAFTSEIVGTLTLPTNCNVGTYAFEGCTGFKTLDASNMTSDVVQQWITDQKNVGEQCFSNWAEDCTVVFNNSLSQDEINYLTNSFTNIGLFPGEISLNIETNLLTYESTVAPKTAFDKTVYTTQAERAELLDEYITEINDNPEIFKNDLYLMFQNMVKDSYWYPYFRKCNGLISSVEVNGNRVSFKFSADVDMYMDEAGYGLTLGCGTTFTNLRVADIVQNTYSVFRGSAPTLYNVLDVVADEQSSIFSNYNKMHFYELDSSGNETDLDSTFGGYATTTTSASENELGLIYETLVPGATYYLNDLTQEQATALENIYNAASIFWYISLGYSSWGDAFEEQDEETGKSEFLGFTTDLTTSYYENASISANYQGAARMYGYTNNYDPMPAAELTADQALAAYKLKLDSLSGDELTKFIREELYYGLSQRFADEWNSGQMSGLSQIVNDYVQIDNITLEKDASDDYKLSFTIQLKFDIYGDGATGIFSSEKIQVKNLRLFAVENRTTTTGSSRPNVYWKATSYGSTSESDLEVNLLGSSTIVRTADSTQYYPSVQTTFPVEWKASNFQTYLEDPTTFKTWWTQYAPIIYLMDFISAQRMGSSQTGVLTFQTGSAYLRNITIK